MKQLFEWIKATPDNLPKHKTRIMTKWGKYAEQAGKLTVTEIKLLIEQNQNPEVLLDAASPLPISGDEEKMYSEDEIKKIVGAVAYDVKHEGYGAASVANVYANMWMENKWPAVKKHLDSIIPAGHQARDGEVEKLVMHLEHVILMSGKWGKEWFNKDDWEKWETAREALKPYQSPVKETI